MVAGEVRDLRLPAAGVDDRPGRHEQHRGFAVPIAFPEDADSIALHGSRLIGIARSHCFASARLDTAPDRTDSKNSRNTMFIATGQRRLTTGPRPSNTCRRPPVASASGPLVRLGYFAWPPF